MPRLPPAEKLPLAVRKDGRDSWEGKLLDLDKQMSDILGVPWKVDINPSAIWPYADESSYAKTSLGKCLHDYVDGANYQLKYFIDKFGKDGQEEINTIASAHVLTLDLSESDDIYYCGVVVNDSRQLVIVFKPNNLGVNISSALETDNLTKALNNAPPTSDAKSLNYYARDSINREYNAEIKPVQDRLNEILGQKITLDPNFEANFAKLSADKNTRSDWDKNLGNFTRFYFAGLNDYLTYQKFDSDDMLQEGLLEALDKKKVVFRIVDKLAGANSYYNEPLLEDGVLYLQTTPENFGSNVNDAADKLIDML